MGCVSIVLSLTLHQKSRVIRAISRNISSNVFDRTFNVFNPYPDQRKIVGDHVELLFLFVILGYFCVIPLLVLKILEYGLLLGFITFIICLGLLMPDGALEIYKNVSIFKKAVNNRVSLGKGDLDVLLLLKKIMPKLSIYYLSLGIVLFSSFMVMPYILSTFLLAFAQFASLSFTLAVNLEIATLFAPFLTTLLFTIVAITFMFIAKIAKAKIFELPPSETWSSVDEQFNRIKNFVSYMHHHPTLRSHEPEENQKSE